jgi:hypothetical protein
MLQDDSAAHFGADTTLSRKRGPSEFDIAEVFAVRGLGTRVGTPPGSDLVLPFFATIWQRLLGRRHTEV